MYLPHKNHKNLVDAIQILKLQFKIDLKMVFCGNDVGYLNNLKKYVHKLKLNNSISLAFILEFEAIIFFSLIKLALPQ